MTPVLSGLELSSTGLAALLAAGWAACATAVVLALALRHGKGLPLDVPNQRSMHTKPVPRIGGMAMLAGWGTVLGLAAVSDRTLALVAAAAALLAAVSLRDDRRPLPVLPRLLCHLGAAALAAWAMGLSGWVVMVLGVVSLVWVTNLFNFMDGADGLAGGMALIGFASYGLVAHWAGAAGIALTSLALAGAAAGFLLFNFHPAKVFMGDAGSIPFGFLAGALGLLGWHHGLWPLWFPVLVFLPFVLDASATLARRAMRGERVWQAHREHYYQRLLRMGWSHRRLALWSYLLMIASAGSAVLSCAWNVVAPAALGGWLVVYGLLFAAIEARWRRAGMVQARNTQPE